MYKKGDICLTSQVEGERSLVLILWPSWHKEMLDVAPLEKDIENATSIDFLFCKSETTLLSLLRLDLRLQIPLLPRQMKRIGELTSEGMKWVEALEKGEFSEKRFGSPLTGPEDKRLEAIEKSSSRNILAHLFQEACQEIDLDY
jgi:hypothetical protein